MVEYRVILYRDISRVYSSDHKILIAYEYGTGTWRIYNVLIENTIFIAFPLNIFLWWYIDIARTFQIRNKINLTEYFDVMWKTTNQ